MAAKMGAEDGPGMWMPAGGRGSIRPRPRRLGPAVVQRRMTQTRNTATTAARATGMSATSAPQSGMTRRLVSSRIPFQTFWIASHRGSTRSLRARSPTRQSCGVPDAST